MKPAGHTGRCKVRPLATFPNSGETSAASGGLGAELADLAKAVGAVEESVTGLMGDFTAAIAGMSDQVSTAKRKAQSTLASLVKSRREVAQFRAAAADVETTNPE